MSKYILERLKSTRIEKRGSMAIEIVIGCFIFLMVLCLLMDLVTLGWRFSVISQTNSYIARTIGLQGGVLASAPPGFPGGDAAYVNISELKQNIEQSFARAGIKSNEYRITINGVPLDSGIKVDYRGFLNTEIQVDYQWSFLSNFIPGNVKNTISSKRAVISEFKYRYDQWTGE